MAINPNFVFQDPRIQAGVIGMAQIAAAEEAARLQRQSQSQQSFTAAQVARENAAAERARNDAYLTQRERESARTDATQNKDLELRRIEEENQRKRIEGKEAKFETDREKAARVNAQYKTLDILSRDADDPPTPKEWAAHKEKHGKDLLPDELDTLEKQWIKTRRVAKEFSVMRGHIAAAGNAELRGIDPEKNKSTHDQRVKDYLKLHGDQVRFDPRAGFVPLRPAPREDPPDPVAPVPPPSGAGGVPGIGVRKMPVVEDFLPKTGSGVGNFFMNPGAAIGSWIGRQFGGGSQKPVQSFVPPMGQPGSVSPYDYPTRMDAPIVPNVASIDPSMTEMPPRTPPMQQFGSDLRTWQPPSFIPNTGSVGFYPPPAPPTFAPAPPQAPSPDPGSLWNFLKIHAPWSVAPIFSEGGLIGPMGLAGRSMFGQQPPPQMIPAPPFVPPQYISTDTPPRGMMPFVPPPSYPRLSPFNY